MDFCFSVIEQLETEGAGFLWTPKRDDPLEDVPGFQKKWARNETSPIPSSKPQKYAQCEFEIFLMVSLPYFWSNSGKLVVFNNCIWGYLIFGNLMLCNPTSEKFAAWQQTKSELFVTCSRVGLCNSWTKSHVRTCWLRVAWVSVINSCNWVQGSVQFDVLGW